MTTEIIHPNPSETQQNGGTERGDPPRDHPSKATAAPMPDPAPSPVMVIGASLGGHEALKVILSHLREDSPVTAIVVMHRDPGSGDTLSRLLGRACRIPVIEIEDKMPMEPGRVYLAPPDYHVLIEKDLPSPKGSAGPHTPSSRSPRGPSAALRFHFALSTEDPVRHARPSIDVLFESAAEALGEALVGVILTGANDDGAKGLAAVKAAGGIALVQDPESAEASGMPRAAMASTRADAVLQVKEIGTYLGRLQGQRRARKGGKSPGTARGREAPGGGSGHEP